MTGEESNLQIDGVHGKSELSHDEFMNFIETCLDEGWSPTKCPQGCVVEPDGECAHGFKSVALELDFI